MAKQSPILDPVNPTDFLRLNITYCCEQCAHFCHEKISCTFGFEVEPHLKVNQLRTYEMSGRLAFCRFLEIDI